MKSVKTTFLGGLQTLVIISLFSLVLVPFSVAKAETLLTTCRVETQSGQSGAFLTNSVACAIPSGKTVTRATLTYTLNDGGEITANGQQIFAVAPNEGTDSGTIEIPTNIFNSTNVVLEVVARNAMASDGTFSGQIYGEAIVKLYTSETQSEPLQTPTITWGCSSGGETRMSVTLPSGNVAGFDIDTDDNHTSGYKFYSGSAGQTITSIGTIGSQTLTPNTIYYFRTVAVGGMSHSDWKLSPSGAPCGGGNGGGNPSYCAGSTLTKTEFKKAWDAGAITFGVINVGTSNASMGVTNNTGCLAPLSMSSYKMFDDSLGTQELFKKTFQNIGTSGTLNVELPSCKAQIDVWFGNNVPSTLQDGVNYGDPSGNSWVLKWSYKLAPHCGGTTPTTPTGNITATNCTISEGNSSCNTTLTWSTQNPQGTSSVTTPTNITVAQSNSSNGTSYPVQGGNPNGTRTFYLYNAGYELDHATAIATCATNTHWSGTSCVANSSNTVSVDIRANPSVVDEGDSSTLIWDSYNATSCTASGAWSGNQATGVNRTFNTGSLFSDKTYIITCTNGTSSDSDDVTVRVEDDRDDNDDEGPDVETDPATNVTTSSAVLNGEVDGNGHSTKVWFEYSTDREDVEDSDDVEDTSKQTAGSRSNISFDERISGLRANTTYYFKALAENSVDDDEGQVRSFTTSGSFNPPPTAGQPGVTIYADSTNLPYNGSTTVRWFTINVTSCYGNGGSTGWSGPKSTGSSSFFTGSLTSGKTYSITCYGADGRQATDSVFVNVRGQVRGVTTVRPAPSSLVIITSSLDRSQPILPTLDNSRPHPGDDINYTVTYQNIGTGSVTNLVLRLDLPYEVDYIHSTPSNPTKTGNTLIFNLGTLRANAQGTVTVKVKLRNDAIPGTVLNFPAVLSYVDPSGYPQSVSANVSAVVWGETILPVTNTNTNVSNNQLGAAAFGAGFLPTTLFGWLLLIILILLLVLLAKYLFGQPRPQQAYMLPAAGSYPPPYPGQYHPGAYGAYPQSGPSPYPRKTTTTVIEH